MLSVAPGEVQKTAIRPLEPEKALWLGAHLLEKARDLETERGFELGGYRVRVRTSDEESFGYPLRVNEEAGELLDTLVAAYANSLSPTDQAFDAYDQWLILSMNNSNIPWHTDTPGDVRFMHNLGERTHVDVATEWDPKDYWPGEPDGHKPIASESLFLEPNETYVSNNLVTNTDVLRPHETPLDLSRLVLRTSLYASDGWQETVTEDGITLLLADLPNNVISGIM